MLTTEEILDLLSTLILDLGAIREQMTDAIDRAALNNQIVALTKWWRKLDDIRASETRDDLAEAQQSLKEISKELKKEKKKLVNVAKVIHKGAQAIAIVEKVVKLVA